MSWRGVMLLVVLAAMQVRAELPVFRAVFNVQQAAATGANWRVGGAFMARPAEEVGGLETNDILATEDGLRDVSFWRVLEVVQQSYTGATMLVRYEPRAGSSSTGPRVGALIPGVAIVTRTVTTNGIPMPMYYSERPASPYLRDAMAAEAFWRLVSALTNVVGGGTNGVAGPMGPMGPAGTNGVNGTNGAPGAAGPAGTNAYIDAVTGITVAAGGAAWASNIGTSANAVFLLGIPSGATGATGPQGPAGTNGANGINGTNTVSGSATDRFDAWRTTGTSQTLTNGVQQIFRPEVIGNNENGVLAASGKWSFSATGLCFISASGYCNGLSDAKTFDARIYRNGAIVQGMWSVGMASAGGQAESISIAGSCDNSNATNVYWLGIMMNDTTPRYCVLNLSGWRWKNAGE